MASSNLSVDERIALITDNLQEVIDLQIIEDVMKKEGRDLSVYWGTATTGRPHIGYLVPAMKIAQMLQAGCHIKILLADIHAALDALKTPFEQLTHRASFYRYTISALLKAVNVDISRLTFVQGSSYQTSHEYVMDLFKLTSVTTSHDALKAGAEVVKQSKNAGISEMLYPLMQALDEEYLKVDAQFGGIDQRKIFTFAKSALPKLGYKQRAHLCNRMVPSLQGANAKMSASDPNSKIDLLDDAKTIQKKISKAYAVPKISEDNGLIAFVEHVLLPASKIKHGKPEFVVERTRDGLEPLVYKSAEEIVKDYEADTLTPQLLKGAVTSALANLLEPIQKEYQDSPEWKEVELKAYPPPEALKAAKKVKEKKGGTKHPGASGDQKAEPSSAAVSEGLPHETVEDRAVSGEATEDGKKDLELRQK